MWLMRQAGRYLPEYNATRARAGSFMKLCTDPALATEVTLQPLLRFPLDAAILFSDILTVPDAMGLGLSFTEGEGPRFERPLVDEAAISKLTAPDPSRLTYVYDAVASIKLALAGQRAPDRFCRQPVHTRLLHDRGRGQRRFRQGAAHALCAPGSAPPRAGDQCRGGGCVSCTAGRSRRGRRDDFRHLGGLLAADAYDAFSLSYIKAVLKHLRDQNCGVPTIVFTKGGGQWLDRIAASGCDAVGPRLDDGYRCRPAPGGSTRCVAG